ncbi:Serine/threonine-protein kinase [Mucor velutinosus]|uniref:DNA 3'-5' helicase n=1 Tax=Mucor velutinosus TaxID=708070 RepID=A0AAN7I2Z1_9FUNG|nr:Serine/threonine-protein kinase [Mucor velutinosus]
MQYPYYRSKSYYFSSSPREPSRYQNTRDSNSVIGDWLAREEALLEGMEADITEAMSPTITADPIQLQYPSFRAACPDVSNYPQVPPLANNGGPSINGLRPTSEIPKPFDSVFNFGVFNKIQSKCLDDAFYQNGNLVISAPTGSGKTVVMELAIIRTLLHGEINSKIIYMAPTKSLCSERAKDWQLKFKPLGIECTEFTGDTQKSSIAAIRKTTIIITTPEKWDSMTRRWNDHKQLMKLINLFLIDEVHILNEKRGACLEACVSRMQTMDINLRYIAVSATVPNLQDIATWLHAKPISFSEEYRPIILERFVYGYPYQEGNMFLFDRKLDWKLLEMIEKHSDNKPVLIFCSTRKSTELACSTITNLMDKKRITTLNKSFAIDQSNIQFKNKNLLKFVARGIAFHHAGLDPADRFQVETKFMNREIRVIATTSTLAVGVNLPAHLVIVKSTQAGYQNGSLQEYSDIDLLQMMGRAGRPGLDTSGCAVILTTTQMELRYKSLVSGTTNLESRLHENLIEHLVSEICLGTITNQITALKWLQSTFLYVRLLKNPEHYKLNQDSISSNTILQEICVKDLELLQYHNLIQKSPTDATLKATPFGVAMDVYYIRFPTMVGLMESETPTSVRDTLELISKSHQEIETIRLNQGDKQFLNSIRTHDSVRFPLDKITSVADKVFMMIQCVFGNISLNNTNGGNTLLNIEASAIMKHSSRLTRCLIDCSVHEQNAAKLKYALELYQCLQARMWSNSPYIARQLPGIGAQYAKTIAQANLINFDQLRNCDPGRFEQLLHRNPPFGIKLCKEISILPNLSLGIHQLMNSGSETNRETGNVTVTIHIDIELKNTDVVTRTKQGKSCYVQFWLETSENRLVDFRRTLISNLLQQKCAFDLRVKVESLTSTITGHLQCGDYGRKEFKPKVDPRKFINIASASNMSKPHLTPEINEILEEMIAGDPMDVEDDDTEMQEIFQPPIQVPIKPTSPPPPPKATSNPFTMTMPIDSQTDTDIEEMSDNIDIQAYNRLFNVISNQEGAGPSTSFESKTFQKAQKQKEPAVALKEKKKPNKKKAAAPSLEPCKHQCKQKDKCRHKCCKRSLVTAKVEKDDTPPPIIGTKRPSPDNENKQPSSKRKANASSPSALLAQPAEPSAATTLEPKTSQTDHFSHPSEKDVEMLGRLDNTISEENEAITEAPMAVVASTPTMAETILDQSILDDIDSDSMAGDINTETLSGHPNTVASVIRYTTTHATTCDELWDEVGRLAHQAFSSLNRRSENHDAQEPVTQPDPAISLDLPTPTLKEWITENVILV